MKFLSLLPLLAALALATPAQADSIAFVNMEKIMHDSTAARSVKDQLESKQKSFQSEMSHKEDELNREHDELLKQRGVLSPEAFEKKAKSFRTKTDAAQKDVQSKRNMLNYAVNSSLAEIQKSILDIVAGISHDKGYTVVIPSSALLYADPKLDITNDVLSKLNSSLPKVNVSFKNGGASKDEE